jgi:anti-sigma B factor antagonist
MAFSARIISSGDTPVLRLTGEVGLESEDELESLVLTRFGHEGSNLILDLTEITYIDSWTLGLFLRIEQLLSSRGGGLAIACAQPDVQRLFALTGLTVRLHVFDGLDGAAAYFKSPDRP